MVRRAVAVEVLALVPVEKKAILVPSTPLRAGCCVCGFTPISHPREQKRSLGAWACGREVAPSARLFLVRAEARTYLRGKGKRRLPAGMTNKGGGKCRFLRCAAE
jgi:hypothetical protein